MKSNYVATKVNRLGRLGNIFQLCKKTDNKMPILYSLYLGEENCSLIRAVAENCAMKGKQGCYIEYREWI